jgi:hypothetical protein
VLPRDPQHQCSRRLIRQRSEQLLPPGGERRRPIQTARETWLMSRFDVAEASAFNRRWTQLSERLTPAARLMQGLHRRAPSRLFPRRNGREIPRAAGLGHAWRDGRARVGSQFRQSTAGREG